MSNKIVTFDSLKKFKENIDNAIEEAIDSGNFLTESLASEIYATKDSVESNKQDVIDEDHKLSMDLVDADYASNDDISSLFPARIESSQEFSDALASGEKYLKLVGNVSTNTSFNIAEDAVIDLNGHTIASTNDCALKVYNGASLVINGNGNIDAQEFGVLAVSGSSVEINGGTFTTTDNVVVGTNGTAGKGANTIIINGGTFNGNITTPTYVACGIYAANNDTIILNGGTFNITNGVGVLARSGNVVVGPDVIFNVTGDGTLGKVGDSNVTVPSGEVLVLDLKANYPGGTPTIENNSTYQIYTVE